MEATYIGSELSRSQPQRTRERNLVGGFGLFVCHSYESLDQWEQSLTISHNNWRKFAGSFLDPEVFRCFTMERKAAVLILTTQVSPVVSWHNLLTGSPDLSYLKYKRLVILERKIMFCQLNVEWKLPSIIVFWLEVQQHSVSIKVRLQKLCHTGLNFFYRLKLTNISP